MSTAATKGGPPSWNCNTIKTLSESNNTEQYQKYKDKQNNRWQGYIDQQI